MKIRSFRLKVLLALMGTVAVLTMATLLVVTWLIRQAIDERAGNDFVKAHHIFLDQQAQRFGKLEEISSRLLGSRRLAAALEEADLEVLAGVVRNEQEISKLQHTLLAIVDRNRKTVLRAWDGRIVTEIPGGDVAIEAFVRSGNRSGYFASDQEIFEAVCLTVRTESENLGSMVVAFAVTDQTAYELAVALGYGATEGHDPEVEVGFLLGQTIVASTLPAASRFEVARALKPGSAELDFRDTRYLVFALPLGGVAQQIILLSQRPLEDLLKRLRLSGIVSGGVTLLLCVFISMFLSRGISRPVGELAAAAQGIRSGDYGVRVEPRTADEIGRLAEAFNEMAEGLQLKEKYRGVLDKVVSPEVAEELLSGKIELGGELRSVSVLFCDIRGFTQLTEGMKPQDVLELLNRHMTAMTEIVRRNGGIVDKFVGDEIMAVFGAPKSTGNDARAALTAAIEMREVRERLKATEPVGLRFEIGFGINTGEVVAGNMGSDKQLSYTVLGKTVNLASRLCKAAPPGRILASAPTIDGAGESIRARELEPMDVKGFSEPVRVFEVGGVA